ncbi:LuxR C-terminal-related transcriptional regulator [Streptomyces sp. NPDC090445]|uniref:LuxR C-terminal-related transcriptional regulator n=1 Tax=Streptomyces sp. NPDC090445 TaxID=3365963 RepID=UPI0038182A7E
MTTYASVSHSPLRVAVVERHPLLRAGIRAALSAAGGIEVVMDTGAVPGLGALVGAAAPDVVLLDLDLPGSAALHTCRELVAGTGRRTAVLGMTGREIDEALVRSALLAGVRGYLAKDAGGPDVVGAVHMVARGLMVAGSPVDQVLSGLLTARSRAPEPDVLPVLTRREREILDLVARGYDNRRIARALTLADKTVRNHVSAVLGKIGVSSRGQAIVLARDAGLGTSAR